MEKEHGNNSNPITKQHDWSDLPDDILLLISSKLCYSFSSAVNFNRVCSSWRNATRYRTRSTYPVIFLHAETEEKLMKITIHDIDDIPPRMNDERQYKFKKSSWFVEQTRSLERVIGSRPDGWVILSNQNKELYLLHLFLEIRIQLPNQILASNGSLVQLVQEDIQKTTLSANDPNSPEDFIVVMSYDLGDTPLAFWRHGDCSWTCFGGDPHRTIIDIAFCNNILYVINDEPTGPRYYQSWDFRRNLGLPKKKALGSMHFPAEQYFFVSSEGEIYVFNFLECFTFLKLQRFDFVSQNWEFVDSSNGQTLFLWFGDSMVLSAVDVQRLGYEPNSIYLGAKQGKHIKLSYYSFDDKMWMWEQFWPLQGKWQEFGLFLLST